jgi:hypothetical protein
VPHARSSSCGQLLCRKIGEVPLGGRSFRASVSKTRLTILVIYFVAAEPASNSVGRCNLDIPVYGIQSDYSDVRTTFDLTKHLSARAPGKTFAVNYRVFCNSAFYRFWTDRLSSRLRPLLRLLLFFEKIGG